MHSFKLGWLWVDDDVWMSGEWQMGLQRSVSTDHMSYWLEVLQASVTLAFFFCWSWVMGYRLALL